MVHGYYVTFSRPWQCNVSCDVTLSHIVGCGYVMYCVMLCVVVHCMRFIYRFMLLVLIV